MTNAYADRASTVAAGAPARAVPARWAPGLHALLRIGAGLLFMEHGLQKLFGLFGGMGPSGGSVPLFSQMGLAGVLECGGGLLLVLGLFTRPVAVVLLLEMLYAFATVHLPKGGAPIQNGGELPLLFALIFAFLAGNGAGPASLDSRKAV
jgi:putative oxidoreductase